MDGLQMTERTLQGGQMTEPDSLTSEALALRELLGGGRGGASKNEPGEAAAAPSGRGWIASGYEDWTFAPETAFYVHAGTALSVRASFSANIHVNHGLDAIEEGLRKLI